VIQTHVPDLQRNGIERRKLARFRHRWEIHQCQISTVLLIPGDAFIVVEEIAAAVENQTVIPYLHRPRVV